MIGERNGGGGAWWREGARVWIPVLAIGVTLLISIQAQMLGMQQQIGDLRGEFRGTLRAELRSELSSLRHDLEGQIGALRTDVQALGDRVQAVEERMTSLEAVVQAHQREHARPGTSGEGATGQTPAAGAD